MGVLSFSLPPLQEDEASEKHPQDEEEVAKNWDVDELSQEEPQGTGLLQTTVSILMEVVLSILNHFQNPPL